VGGEESVAAHPSGGREPRGRAARARCLDRAGHVGQRLLDRDLTLDRGVGVVGDRRGHAGVVGRDRPRHRVGDRLLQRRQVAELLDQVGLGVERLQCGSQGAHRQERPLLLLLEQEVDEVDGGRLVVGVGADADVVAAERRGTDTVGTGQRRDVELVLDLRRLLRLGETVDVGPVAVEQRLAGLEVDPALLLGVGDGLLRDVAVGVGLREVLEPGLRLRRVQRGLSVLAEDRAAGAVDRLGRVDRQSFVLGELAGVAVHVVLFGDGAHVHHLVPRGRRRVDQVGAVVEHPAVTGVRRRVEGSVVGAGVDGRLEQALGVDGQVALERLEPALRGELGGPHHVDRHDVVVGVLRLEVADEVVVLLVGLVGLLLEGHLLVGVVGVPLVDDGLPHPRVVLALDVGDRAPCVEALLERRVLRGRPAGVVVAAAGGHRGCDQDQRSDAGHPLEGHVIPPITWGDDTDVSPAGLCAAVR
jgi:hypothetical protein